MTAPEVPAYLKSFSSEYAQSPRTAAIEWFRQAKFGLFLHYGLYSLLAGEWQGETQKEQSAEWIQLRMNIPIAEYAKLARDFTAEKFDADAICQLAKEAGMRYINLTTVHHDGFCLWDTATTDFNSVRASAKRDLVRELTEACDAHGLGCFLYYSHGRDWLHPDSPYNGSDSCRPKCPEDRDHFHWGDDYNLDAYLDYVEAQVMELCQYKNVAGIWLDGIGEFKNMEDGVRLSRCQELYDKIRATSAHILVSYKQGLTYTEDFYAPERDIKHGTAPASDKPYEICTTLQPHSWGCRKSDDGQHHGPDWVMEQLEIASRIPANLLLNTGPLADGRIPDEDVATLREVGKRLASNG